MAPEVSEWPRQHTAIIRTQERGHREHRRAERSQVHLHLQTSEPGRRHSAAHRPLSARQGRDERGPRSSNSSSRLRPGKCAEAHLLAMLVVGERYSEWGDEAWPLKFDLSDAARSDTTYFGIHAGAASGRKVPSTSARSPPGTTLTQSGCRRAAKTIPIHNGCRQGGRHTSRRWEFVNHVWQLPIEGPDRTNETSRRG